MIETILGGCPVFLANCPDGINKAVDIEKTVGFITTFETSKFRKWY